MINLKELLAQPKIPSIATSKGASTIFAASQSRFTLPLDQMKPIWLSMLFKDRQVLDVESQAGLIAAGVLTLNFIQPIDCIGIKYLVSVPDNVALSNLAFRLNLVDAAAAPLVITWSVKPLRKNFELIALFGTKSGDRLYPFVNRTAITVATTLATTITGANNISISAETYSNNHPEVLEVFGV